MIIPKTFAKIVTTPTAKKDTWLTIGKKKPAQDPLELEEISRDITTDSFLYLYDLGRKFNGEGDSTVFTTDKKNISFFNFLKGSNPDMIQEAYTAGLIKSIYPSNNLQEIKYLPKKIKEAVKKFRTNCVKNTEKEIFLEFKSTIPVWSIEGLLHKPKHLIKIGLARKIIPEESKVMESSVQPEELTELAVLRAEQFIGESLKIGFKDKVFINYVDQDHLVYSKSLKATETEDVEVIRRFQVRVISGNLLGFHCPSLCQYITQIVTKANGTYQCNKCHVQKEVEHNEDASDKGGPTTRENESAKEEDKSSTNSTSG